MKYETEPTLKEIIDKNDKMFSTIKSQLDDIERKVESINRELKKLANNEEN